MPVTQPKTAEKRIFTPPKPLCRIFRATAWLFIATTALVALGGCNGLASPGARAPRSHYTGDIIRVRLERSLESVHISCPADISLRNDRYSIASFPAGSSLTIMRRQGYWLVNGSSYYGRYLELVSSMPNKFLSVEARRYRGKIVLHPVESKTTGIDWRGAQGGRIAVDNHLPLEQYLCGVLSCELYGHWDIETYKALAITSRTYALYEMSYGTLGADFDVYGHASQVYGGADKESYRSVTAVTETRGLVLTWKHNGRQQLFKAYFSSCCGGRTTPAEAMASFDVVPTPLAGDIECTDCKWAPRYSWPTLRLSKQDIYAALAQRYASIKALGGVKQIVVTKQSDHGRPIMLQIVGPTGASQTLRAEDFRLVMLRNGPAEAKQLYSMNCQIADAGGFVEFRSGHGHGHGVGLCPYGAEGMARRGVKFYDILYHYFPGARIMQYH